MIMKNILLKFCGKSANLLLTPIHIQLTFLSTRARKQLVIWNADITNRNQWKAILNFYQQKNRITNKLLTPNVDKVHPFRDNTYLPPIVVHFQKLTVEP